MARPKRVFTDEEEQKIGEYALNNCHMDTIALALNIPLSTLNRRYGGFIRQKRAEGRVELRDNQAKLAKTQPAMSIFLGKNVLGQVDKQTIVDEKPRPTLADDELVEYQRAARNIIKLRQAKAGG